MDRRAVAATLVSVIFFSTLLLGNAAVYAAAGTLLSSAELSTAQQRESQYATALLGVSSFSSLSSAESFLQQRPLGCSSASSYLSSMGGSGSAKGVDLGVDYSLATTWSYASSGQAGDELSELASFDGYSAGALNLLVTTKINESLLGGLPSYSVQQPHYVHLPIDVDVLTSLCLSTLAKMRQTLSSLPSCNSSSVEEALHSIGASHPDLGSVEMGASARESGTGCIVDYWVTIAQSYEGVSGPSEWSVFGAQTVSI